MELIVVFSPLIAFLIIGFLGRQMGDKVSAIVTVLASAVSFIFTLL